MTEPALAISVTGKGRMYRHPVTDALYPSVTNIIDVLAKPWLGGWAAKMVAGEAFDQRKAIMELEDRDQAIDMLKGAPYRKRNKAAAVGDTIHRYAEAVARNEPPPEIDAEHEPFVGAFLEFLEEFRPRFRVLEGIIFHGTPEALDRYAGTFDALVDVPDIRSEGARWVTLLLDYKTGASVYAEAALQLAALQRGEELWDPDTGDLLELPPIDACIAVNLRPDEYKVHLMDTGDAAYEAFMGLRLAWPWEKDHTNAVGPAMNLHRLIREIDRPVELEDQLRLSVEQASEPVAAGGTASVAGPGLDPGSDDPHEPHWPAKKEWKGHE